MSLLLKQALKPRRKQRLLLSAMLVLLAGCGDNSNSGGADSESGTGAAPLKVQVASVESRATEATFWSAGVVAPVRRARLGTRQAGSVQEVLVEAGDSVETGQPVLRVDARDLQAALNAARLVRQAATTARETASRNRERFQRLFEQQLIARARLEEVELAAEDARQRLEQAEAELAAIEVNLDYAMLRAPFSGVVSEVLADVGTFVAPGPPLVIFEDRSRLEVNAAIGQDTGARLVSGATLRLRAQGVEQRMSGRIQALLPALERPGVGRRLRLVIDEPPPGLAPGMVVEIELPAAGPTREFMVIPDSAVLPRGQLDGVFVVEPDDQGQLRAYLRWISIAPQGEVQASYRVHVLHGLSSGERVVVGEAVKSLVDGQRVRLDGS